MKRIVIISGGTMNYIAVHQALCAPAYGSTGRELVRLCEDRWNPWERGDRVQVGGSMFEQLRKYTADIDLRATKMADPRSPIETNADVEKLIDDLVDDPAVKVIFMPVALCDFEPAWPYTEVGDERQNMGKHAKRLSSKQDYCIALRPAKKIISRIRSKRKDIFLVGFKTTDGVTEQEQYLAGLNLLKEASCNLVLANDVRTRVNMIITPEEARYHVSTDRQYVLHNLVEMAWLRSHLTFTRSTVIAGEPVPWESELVPTSLRKVVDHCIAAGAYKPFRGATVGHFACKIDERTFLTSRRKTNFNDLPKLGLVRIETDGPDTVLAYGSKPSVGGQSQRLIFQRYPGYDCIVHFHCPLRPGASTFIPKVSQREYECGSHQCGENTARGLVRLGNLSCVFLDQHGPNIVFHHSIDPEEVIRFIDDNFDLSQKTGGPV